MEKNTGVYNRIFIGLERQVKNMTVDIVWAKDKRDIRTHNTQIKTFNSEEQVIEGSTAAFSWL